jgi:hypothetical protein
MDRKGVILMDQPTTNNVACTDCHAVTTNDGKTVWVCEQCGVENKPVEAPEAVDAMQAEVAAAAAQVSTTTPVAPALPVEEKPVV